jgi:hypothetical protein
MAPTLRDVATHASGSGDDRQGGEPARADVAAIDATPDTAWLVDAYNVLHVILLGGEDRSQWWRATARDRLIERAARMPVDRGRVWLVFDGGVPAPESDAEGAGPRIVFTPSADDWIHQRARRSIGPAPVVVTADRKLARRCRRVGARIVSPGDFIAACPLDPPGA